MHTHRPGLVKIGCLCTAQFSAVDQLLVPTPAITCLNVVQVGPAYVQMPPAGEYQACDRLRLNCPLLAEGARVATQPSPASELGSLHRFAFPNGLLLPAPGWLLSSSMSIYLDCSSSCIHSCSRALTTF